MPTSTGRACPPCLTYCARFPKHSLTAPLLPPTPPRAQAIQVCAVGLLAPVPSGVIELEACGRPHLGMRGRHSKRSFLFWGDSPAGETDDERWGWKKSTAAEDQSQWVPNWMLEQAEEMLAHRGTTAAGRRHIDDETIRQEATGDCIEWDMLSATVHVGGGGLRGRSTTRLHDRQE